jgi:hypothetical protein
MVYDPSLIGKYEINRRVKRAYYAKLVDALSAIGIYETDLDPSFARFKWQEQRKYLERQYSWLFYCVRCHMPYRREDYKHPRFALCIQCASVYTESPEFVYVDHSRSSAEQQERDRALRKIEALQKAKDNTPTDQPTPKKMIPTDDRVSRLLNLGARQELIEDLQHETPLDASKTDEPTEDESEES